MASSEQMDVEEPVRTPIMSSENVANICDWQQHANSVTDALEAERKKHGRTKSASRRLQAQVDSFTQHDLRFRRHLQILQNSNFALSQEISRLRCTVDTLKGVVQIVSGHPNCCSRAGGFPVALETEMPVN